MLAYSSELYLLKTEEIQALPRLDSPKKNPQAEVVVLLDNITGDAVINGADSLQNNTEEFIPVRLAYQSYPVWLGILLNILKPVKRKFYKTYSSTYTTTLNCLLNNNITRGERTAANAYQWTNKKWQISPAEAHQRYQELYNSIKAHGYDKKTPMYIMLNRKFGVKDQLLQGHHRIGICKDLKIKEVAVSFWSAPKSADIFKLFIKGKK